MEEEHIKYITEVGTGKYQNLFGNVVDGPIQIGVIDANIGYIVLLKWVEETQFLKWFREIDEAIEFGVDKAREYRKNGAPVFGSEG